MKVSYHLLGKRMTKEPSVIFRELLRIHYIFVIFQGGGPGSAHGKRMDVDGF